MALLTTVAIPCPSRPGPSGAEATPEVSTCTRGLLYQPATAKAAKAAKAANGSSVIAPGRGGLLCRQCACDTFGEFWQRLA